MAGRVTDVHPHDSVQTKWTQPDGHHHGVFIIATPQIRVRIEGRIEKEVNVVLLFNSMYSHMQFMLFIHKLREKKEC